MAATVILNGHTYSLAILSGTDGRDYARPETITNSGVTLWDLFFTDLVTTMSSTTTIAGLIPGAAGGYIRSNGTAWVRVDGVAGSDIYLQEPFLSYYGVL
jgi:hypothetical protein